MRDCPRAQNQREGLAETARTEPKNHRTEKAGYRESERGAGHRRHMSAEPMSESDSDAMDKEKAAFPIRQTWRMQKEETPNGTTGIPCRTMDERRKTRQLGLSASNADVMDEERAR